MKGLALHFDGIPDDVAQAAGRALELYVRPERVPFAAARFDAHLDEVTAPSRAEYHFELRLVPLGGRLSANGRRKTYSEPAGALEGHYVDVIPAEDGLAYRGMSFEEWAEAVRRGYFQSRGEYNLGEAQRGLTFFSPDPGSAAYYASGFAPWPFKPGWGRPGIVVGAPAAGMVTPEDDPDAVPGGELAWRGQMPLGAVQAVWRLEPVEIDVIRLELDYTPPGRYREALNEQTFGGGVSVVVVPGEPMAKNPSFRPQDFQVPADHEPAMRVPKGGSSCANCRFYSQRGGQHGTCHEPNYARYYGTKEIPYPADEFCSDWYEPIYSLGRR